MKKDRIANILIMVLVGILTSTVTAYATTYLYNSSEVSYDNTTSGLTSKNVQGAVNELYEAAVDYGTLNTKINNYFKSDPTSYFSANSLMVGKNNTSTTAPQSVVQLYQSGDSRGGLYSGTSAITLAGRNGTSGDWGSGTVNLRASTIDIGSSTATVKIGGINVSSVESWTSTPVQGITVTAEKIGKVVFLYIAGTATEDLATSGAYLTIATLPAGYRPPINFVEYKLYNSTYEGQLSLQTGGSVRLGYTRKIAAPTTNVAFAKDTSVYMTLTFVAA